MWLEDDERDSTAWLEDKKGGWKLRGRWLLAHFASYFRQLHLRLTGFHLYRWGRAEMAFDPSRGFCPLSLVSEAVIFR